MLGEAYEETEKKLEKQKFLDAAVQVKKQLTVVQELGEQLLAKKKDVKQELRKQLLTEKKVLAKKFRKQALANKTYAKKN